MSLQIKVKCPRCRKIWSVPQGTPDIICDCHLYCEDGDEPGDCSMSKVTFTGKLGGFTGLHISAETGDDELHRTYYCSTHRKYSYKTPILIEVNAEEWFSHRAPKGMRHLGEDGLGT